jgi:hypothetical protein
VADYHCPAHIRFWDDGVQFLQLQTVQNDGAYGRLLLLLAPSQDVA